MQNIPINRVGIYAVTAYVRMYVDRGPSRREGEREEDRSFI